MTVDLSDIDFAGLSRSEIVAALMDAAYSGYADFADEPEDGRGRLMATEGDDANQL